MTLLFNPWATSSKSIAACNTRIHTLRWVFLWLIIPSHCLSTAWQAWCWHPLQAGPARSLSTLPPTPEQSWFGLNQNVFEFQLSCSMSTAQCSFPASHTSHLVNRVPPHRWWWLCQGCWGRWWSSSPSRPAPFCWLTRILQFHLNSWLTNHLRVDHSTMKRLQMFNFKSL